jgi:hypothetical protein
VTYSVGSKPVCVVVGDVNNDIQLDIVVVNWFDDNVGVLLGYGNGSFANQLTYSTGSYPVSVAVGDFNNDNRLDIVVANQNGNSVGVLLGYGNGSFANQLTYSTGSAPVYVAVGDFNNDNRLDIVAANQNGDSVSVILGYGNGSFTNQLTYLTGSTPVYVAVGDFNNDNRLDIVVVNALNDSMSILLGYGNGSFRNQIMYSTGSYPLSVAVGDFNDDNQLDVVVTNYDGNNTSICLGHSNEVFVSKVTLTTTNSFGVKSFAVGDFNNDDKMDISVANSDTDNIGIFLGYGNLSFANEIKYSTGFQSSPYAIAVGDFNNDTYLDIVVANYGSDNVGIFLGYGNGSFTNQTSYSTSSGFSPRSVAVTDFNNDTILDIVIAYQDSNNLGVFLGHGNGTFANAISFSLGYGSHPFSVVVGDFNDDKKVDIAIANDGTDSLNILLQTC